MDEKMGLIGAGNMGSALVAGMIRAGVIRPDGLLVTDVDGERLAKLAQTWKVRTSPHNRDAVQNRGIVLLAVKPQIVGPVLDEIAEAAEGSPLFLSIAAGVKTAFIEERLGGEVPVVRAMPNTPATIEAGISALCAGRFAGPRHLQQAEEILGAVGETVQVEERQMDGVTGLSGSGPAYIYVIIEALADGGVKMGLPKGIALKLAAHTVLGAAKMVVGTGTHPALLKDAVTSPGGTTIAGLHTLEAKGLRDALISAVVAAAIRSEELGA